MPRQARVRAPAEQAVHTVVLTFFGPEYHPWQWAAETGRPFDERAEMLSADSSERPLLLFRNLGALVICTGMGPRAASAAVTALGFDDRFDVAPRRATNPSPF